MLSLLSDTYRGKTQGLRIGGAACDIKDAAFDVITPSTDGTGVLQIRSATGTMSPFVTFDSSQGEAEFNVGTRFDNGLYTGVIYPRVSGGEIDSLATAVNRKSTYSLIRYQAMQNFSVNGTSFITGTPFPASLASSVSTYTNFDTPFNPTLFGWSESVAFTESSTYTVSVAISATSSNHPVQARLAMIDPSNGNGADFLATMTIPTGTAGDGSLTGTVNIAAPFTHIGVVFYSPQGATTLNNFNMNVTFNRLN